MATNLTNDFGIEIKHLYKIFGYQAHARLGQIDLDPTYQ